MKIFKIDLKPLSETERVAWRMRWKYGWRMKKIALKMGYSTSGISKMLARAQIRVGLPKRRVSIIRTKPRPVRVRSLSNYHDY